MRGSGVPPRPRGVVSGECELGTERALLGPRFKTYWFLQKDGQLEYYSSRECRGAPAGRIDLITCNGVSFVEDTMQLRTPYGRLLLRPTQNRSVWWKLVPAWIAHLREEPLERFVPSTKSKDESNSDPHSWGYRKTQSEWERLYFRLQGGHTLQYYRSPDAEDPLGFLVLSSVAQVSSALSEHQFFVIKVHLRTGALWTLGFESRGLADDWKHRLTPANTGLRGLLSALSSGHAATPELTRSAVASSTIASTSSSAAVASSGVASGAALTTPSVAQAAGEPSRPFNVSHDIPGTQQLRAQASGTPSVRIREDTVDADWRARWAPVETVNSASSEDVPDTLIETGVFDSTSDLLLPALGQEGIWTGEDASKHQVFVDRDGNVSHVSGSESFSERGGDLDDLDGDMFDEPDSLAGKMLSTLAAYDGTTGGRAEGDETLVQDLSQLMHISREDVYDETDPSLERLRERFSTYSSDTPPVVVEAAIAEAIDRQARMSLEPNADQDKLLIERTRAAQLLREGLGHVARPTGAQERAQLGSFLARRNSPAQSTLRRQGPSGVVLGSSRGSSRREASEASLAPEKEAASPLTPPIPPKPTGKPSTLRLKRASKPGLLSEPTHPAPPPPRSVTARLYADEPEQRSELVSTDDSEIGERSERVRAYLAAVVHRDDPDDFPETEEFGRTE